MAQAGARNPGRQIQNRVLDYDDTKDLKFYRAATEKLEETYDGNNLPTKNPKCQSQTVSLV
jgi:hypothetical protein